MNLTRVHLNPRYVYDVYRSLDVRVYDMLNEKLAKIASRLDEQRVLTRSVRYILVG